GPRLGLVVCERAEGADEGHGDRCYQGGCRRRPRLPARCPSAARSTIGCMLDDLTPQQRDAVTHAAGPLLVVAGAGAGKTRVLCRRLAWLVDRGAAPGEVLALTFSARAAAALRSRAEEALAAA